jgi:predicted Zn-dependent protease
VGTDADVRPGRPPDRATGGPGPLLAFLLVLALLAVAAWRLGVPWLADLVAGQVPREWERELGDALVVETEPASRRVTESAVQGPVGKVFGRLAGAGAAGAEPARLLVVRDEVPNAFVAPGGAVLVTTGLLRELERPEELAAVLAHELGHVASRHALRGLLRQAGLRALLVLVAGDASALSGSLRVAGGLGGLAYSRGFEREADDAAVRSLARVGLDPGELAAALERVRRSSPGGPEIGFLSTHPAPAGRLARLERARRSVTRPPAPLVSGEEWRAMKAALPAPGSAKATR